MREKTITITLRSDKYTDEEMLAVLRDVLAAHEDVVADSCEGFPREECKMDVTLTIEGDDEAYALEAHHE